MYVEKKPIDIITVSDALKGKHTDPLNYITGLSNVPASYQNIKHYIEQLKNYTARRQAIRAAQEIIESVNDMTAEEIRAVALSKFDFKNMEDEKKTDIASVMDNVMDDIETKYNAEKEDELFTGFYDIDRFTAGLHPGEMTIVAARTAVGKTAFSIQLMLNLARKNVNSTYISREMSSVQLGKRILANTAKIDSHKLRLCKTIEDKDWESIKSVISTIKSWNIEINDEISTIQELVTFCREKKVKSGLDLLIVDYIGLIRTLKKCGTREQEVADVSRQLKEISLELNIPVITLCQLNRDSVGDKEPGLHHLRESGSLEQDADNVIFLHVPPDTDKTADYYDVDILISKQRNGSEGKCKLRFYRRSMRFDNIYYK
jgi:replicative DNA helicase